MVAVAVIALVVGAFIPAQAQGPRKDNVVVLLGQEPAELFQGFVSNLLVESDVEAVIYCSDIGRDDQWKLYGDLAVKVPTLKDGDWQLLPGKKMKVTYKLKQGYKWHDGKPVTATDYVWTFRMRKNPNTPVVSRFIENKINNVLAPDPYTVTYQWNEIYAYANLGYFLLPSHILLREFNRNPAQIDRSPFARAPVHCGPYKFKQWVPGSYIEVEASPETYGGEKPKIKTITFRFILDSTVLTANLLAGQGDATATGGPSLEQLEEIAKRAPHMKTHTLEGLTWEHIDFNMDNEWLKDKRVRHAIAYAIDREAMVQGLFQGRQPVAHTYLGPRHFAHNKTVKKYNYDPARARQLLAEAGFTAGPDGTLRDQAGKRFEISIMTTTPNPVREQVELIIKDQLKQVGIDLKIDNRPASVLFGQVTRQRTYPHLVMYAWSSGPTTHYRTIWHSKEIPTAANNYVGQNTPGYKNLEVDRLLELAEEELDEAKRRDYLLKVQELWAEDMPSLPLFFRLELNASRKTLVNYKPRGLGNPTWNAEQWLWSQ